MDNTRINKIKGQINGIEKMIAEKRDCMDVVQQIVAVRAALSQLGVELLKNEADICACDKENGEESLKKIIDKLFKIT